MNKRTRFIICFFLCFCCTSIFAQTEDDNVIITSMEDVFTFKLNDNKEPFIEEKSSAAYECTRISEKIVLAKFYDNSSEVENVRIKGLKGVKPEYSMYQEEGLFYNDTKICTLNLPFTLKNRNAEVSFKKIFHDPHYFSGTYLSEPLFVKNKTVKLVVPYWMDIDIYEKNFGTNVKKEVITDEKEKTHTYIYHIENQKAEKQEPYRPGFSYIYPHLIIVSKTATTGKSRQSIFDNLSTLYQWNHGATLQDNSDSTIIRNKLQEIVKDCSTPESKIKAIYAWVQDNIRYIANEYGIMGFKPDDAQNVLQKKYGDCKGMANLLKSLLVTAGFDARLVWIATNQIDFDFTVPLPNSNHMICALKWNNKLYFLDPTVKYMPLGQYPQSIQGRKAMIEDGDNYLIENTPTVSPAQNTDSLSCEYTVTAGALSGKAVNSFYGESKQLTLLQIHATEKDRQANVIRQFLEKGKVQDKATDILLSGTESQSDCLSISYQVERKSAIQAFQDELYIDPDAIKDYAEITIDTTKRENDYLFPFKDRTVRQFTIQIPQGYKVTGLPSGQTFKNSNLLFTVSYTQKDNKIIYRKEITLFDPWIKKSHFKEWNDQISAIRKVYMEQITLKKL
ncbi:transglutaminase domain-containing protein [uncultured Bacteroides sp.]|uniref:transglutaminase domain-containing protein n=1 Tax=uncultured Bacteroides sp. TaxID=162156 RepID=UPI002AAB8343|nr:transglutaminase domain-containing protein [uncultured Bacteroides sp.]